MVSLAPLPACPTAEHAWSAYLVLTSTTVAPEEPRNMRARHQQSRHSHPWQEEPGYEGWLSACYQITARVQRLDARHALLDLGCCTADEAREVTATLLRRLARRGIAARIGLGPSLTLAQLALLHHPPSPGDPICLLTPEAAPVVLRAVQVRCLPALHPRGTVTAEVVARLERYGLRTLAHLARLEVQALRRQFGVVGETLAAFAAGADPLPLVPTRPPRTLALRLRFAEPIAPACVAEAIPRLARRVSARLDGFQVTRGITFGLRWDARGWVSASTILRAPVRAEFEITRECTRLLAILLADQSTMTGDNAVAGLCCRLVGIAPRVVEQESFWRTRGQQRAAVEQVAQVLTRRYSPGIMSRLLPEAPDAIFPEERYSWSALHADAEAASVNGPRLAAATVGLVGLGSATDPWADVPQRMHWW